LASFWEGGKETGLFKVGSEKSLHFQGFRECPSDTRVYSVTIGRKSLGWTDFLFRAPSLSPLLESPPGS
jgi:hypothetical protein